MSGRNTLLEDQEIESIEDCINGGEETKWNVVSFGEQNRIAEDIPKGIMW